MFVMNTWGPAWTTLYKKDRVLILFNGELYSIAKRGKTRITLYLVM